MPKKTFFLIIFIIVALGSGILMLHFLSGPEQKILVTNPKADEIISSPFLVEGSARGNWFFEASFPIFVVDANGRQIGQGIAQAQSDWMTTDFVPFKSEIEFSLSPTEKGELVLKRDNPSGLSQYDEELRIPIRFETLTIKVFFNNSGLDPEFSCNKVFPVERKIFKTLAVARSSLEELFKGPTSEEQAQKFFTSINQGVKIQKLTIEDGVAKVDFNDQLEFQVGGSCRVSAIRSQIIETLKQFPTIKDVVISINGRTEDILQP